MTTRPTREVQAERSPLASFLLPAPFRRPPLTAIVRERRVAEELGRYVVHAGVERVERIVPMRHTRDDAAGSTSVEGGDPVMLVPGFMAGDATLALMAGELRARGFRTYRSHIRANIGCTRTAGLEIEARLESIAARRGSRVQILGHSLGGMIARGVAARRPDLVAGIVTMGSPMLAPGAHHPALSWGVDALVRLDGLGVPGLMGAECVAGSCARESFEDSRAPLAADVGFTAIYSRRDGVVDWRACIDPIAEAVEVRTSHCGMAFDPHVIDVASRALRRQADAAQTAYLRIA